MPRTRTLTRGCALLLCLSLLLTSAPAAIPSAFAQEPVPAIPALPASPDAGYSISGKVATAANVAVAGVSVTVTFVGKPQIILLPGVMGTALKNKARANTGCNPTGRIWVSGWNIEKVAQLGPLILNTSGTGPAVGACDIDVDGPIKVGLWGMLGDPYSAFLNRADDNYDVLPYMGYDWRYDLEAQAVKLDDWINDNADLSRPIYLVAHSMGGLVARAFVADQARAANIAGVVTVGTPYLGAPIFLERAAGGLTGTRLDPVIDNDELRALIRFSPGVLQLVPSLRWFFREEGAGPAYVRLNGEALNYAHTEQLLVDAGLAGASVLPKSEAFHDKLDGFDRPFFADGKYTVLYSAMQLQTPFQYSVQCSAEQQECWSSYTVKGPGDGTVPVESASLSRLSSSAREGVVFCRYDDQVPEHGDLLTNNWVINDILAALNGLGEGENTHCSTTSAVASADASSTNGSATDHRDIIIHGDVRVRVFDGAGNMTGPDDDGLIVWNIPDVSYQLIAGGVAVAMPVSADHRIEILQEGTEGIRVLASDFGPSTEPEQLVAQTRSTFSGVGADGGAVLTIPNAGAAVGSLTLALDTNADGTPEQTLPPDAVLTDPVQAQDVTMPTSTITLAGIQDAQWRYIGPVTVTVTAQDNAGGSGLLASYTSLDAGQTWQKYFAPVQVPDGGATSVQVYSTDKAGNPEYPPKVKAIDFAAAPDKVYLPTISGPDVQSAAAPAPLPMGPLSMGPQPAAAAEPAAPAVPAVTVVTNAQGNYTFANLPAGVWNVTAAKSSYTITPAKRTVTVPPNATTNINFTATPLPFSDMIHIPTGLFQMGCSPDDTQCDSYESPLHAVNLSAYAIDTYEVTNARYAACVATGACTLPYSTQAYSTVRGYYEYYGVAQYANFPVIYVDWSQATAFCAWDGKRLPTEAEWEKAARGTAVARIYPWGNATPDCTLGNFLNQTIGHHCVGEITAVGSYPTGASPYGVMDMSGNVWEWVNDWWQSDYYATSPANDPQGPVTGSSRVLRGGSWDCPYGFVRASSRSLCYALGGGNGFGFRCVRPQ